MSYTDLMDTLEVVSTGLLNYHLKVLSDLLAKNEDGKYVLTEKGKLASKLLLEFPAQSNLGKIPTWWRKFWVAHAIFDTAYVIVNLTVYFLGYIDLATLYWLTFGLLCGIGFGYMIAHIKKDVLSAEGLQKLNRGLYLLLGVFVGGFGLWGGLTIAMNKTGVRLWLDGIMGDGALALTTLIICYIIGGLLGNWIGKKTNYYLPHYP